MAERVDAHFAPAAALSGTIAAPPDKSISHRAALLGAFGEGTARISRYLDSADTRSSLAAVEALGATVRTESAGPGALDVEIAGFGLRGASEPAAGAIDVGNAGTLIRLLAGLLAGQEERSFVLDGDESIRTRPMGPYRRAAPGHECVGRDDRRRPPAGHDRRPSGSGRSTTAAGRLRAGEVVRPPGGAARFGPDDDPRARRDP